MDRQQDWLYFGLFCFRFGEELAKAGIYVVAPSGIVLLKVSQVLAYRRDPQLWAPCGKVPIHFVTGIHQVCESLVRHRLLQARLKK